jgi:hypothetical protein
VADDEVPSPKFQLYVEAPGALGVEVFVNVTATPWHTVVSLATKETTGGV